MPAVGSNARLTILGAVLCLGLFGMMPAPAAAPGKPLTGEWGGDHVALTFAEGTARLQFDCAGGSIDTAVVPDAAGRFDVAGTFWRLSSVLRVDAPPQKRPARWKGETDGRTMKLTGTIVEDGTDLGTFELERGRPSRLRRCA
jgi:hypothetical protein